MSNQSENKHWAAQQERGSKFSLRLTGWLVKYCPLWLIRFITFWVVGYFYLTSRKARGHIAEYHHNLQATFQQVRLKKGAIFRQYLAFGEAITDCFAVWQQQIHYDDLIHDDPDNVYGAIDSGGRGQILVCSHFGNIEICRALSNSGHHPNFKLNALVHNKHAKAFNQALEQAGASAMPIIQVEQLDVAKMLELKECIERGEWIAIAADRIPVRGDKTQAVDFLGKSAEFPEGAWFLASLLKTKINTIFCVKEQGRYRFKLRHFSDGINGRGTQRQQNIQQAMQDYANLLAKECAKNPYQWFNFYDFWQQKNGD